MCLEATIYFEEALKYKKGTTKYKTAVKNGLMYLGYALHPIQDIYAHTPDRCYRSPVPHMYYFTDVNGEILVGSYFVLGWSHVRPFDKTDNVVTRPEQVEKTKTHTIKILETFAKNYKNILSKDNGVKI